MKIVSTRRGQLANGRIVAPGETVDVQDSELALITDDPVCGWQQLADPAEHAKAESARQQRLAEQGRARSKDLANATQIEPPLHGHGPRDMGRPDLFNGQLPDGTR